MVALQCNSTMNSTEVNGTELVITRKMVHHLVAKKCSHWHNNYIVHASFHPPLYLMSCDRCCQSHLPCGSNRHNVC